MNDKEPSTTAMGGIGDSDFRAVVYRTVRLHTASTAVKPPGAKTPQTSTASMGNVALTAARNRAGC